MEDKLQQEQEQTPFLRYIIVQPTNGKRQASKREFDTE